MGGGVVCAHPVMLVFIIMLLSSYKMDLCSEMVLVRFTWRLSGMAILCHAKKSRILFFKTYFAVNS